MKRPWTRAEKSLFLAPLLVIVGAFALYLGPNVARRTLGLPEQLSTTPTTELSAIALSRDGSVLAATGLDDGGGRLSSSSGTVYLWDALSLRPLPTFMAQQWRNSGGDREGFWLHGLSLSPNGKLIGVSGRGAQGFAVYEVASQNMLWRSATGAGTAVFSVDGRYVAFGIFELREARSGKLIARWTAGNGSLAHTFRVSSDRRTVAWIGVGKKWRPSTGQNTPRDPAGKSIEIRRTSDGKVLNILKDSQETVAVNFSPDDSKIISVARAYFNTNGTDGSIIRCHSITGKLLWQSDYRSSNPKRIRSDIFCDAVFSPDGNNIAVRSTRSEGGLLILDASNGRETQQLIPRKGQDTNIIVPPALAFSPDGKRIFARGRSAVLVWHLK